MTEREGRDTSAAGLPTRVQEAKRTSPARLLLWVAFLLPLAYLGILLAVTVHEVLGHGLVAHLAGGAFRGFEIHPDGMGYALAWAPGHDILVLSAGIAADIVFGALALLAGFLLRRRPLLAATFAVLALTLFLDGLPYGFWDAWFQGDRGDVGRILHRTDWHPLRIVLLVGIGLVYVLSSALSCSLLFGAVEVDQGPLSRRRATVVAAGIAAGVAIGSAAFDWNQLIPGADQVPLYGELVLFASIAVWLVLRRRQQVDPRPVSSAGWTAGISLAWLAAAALLVVVLLELENGVRWG